MICDPDFVFLLAVLILSLHRLHLRSRVVLTLPHHQSGTHSVSSPAAAPAEPASAAPAPVASFAFADCNSLARSSVLPLPPEPGFDVPPVLSLSASSPLPASVGSDFIGFALKRPEMKTLMVGVMGGVAVKGGRWG